jgi:hypothetical protein
MSSELKGPGMAALWREGVGVGRTRKRTKAVQRLVEQNSERVASLGRCPNCRSTQFTQSA